MGEQIRCGKEYKDKLFCYNLKLPRGLFEQP